MPVRLNQIAELYDTFTKYVDKRDIRDLILDLKQTAAYSTNTSFRDTIDRLMAEHARRRLHAGR